MMSRLLSIGLIVLASLLMVAHAGACPPISEAHVPKVQAFSEDYAGALIARQPHTGRYYVLLEPCYQLTRAWRANVEFSINNFVTDAELGRIDDAGVQVAKLTPRSADEPADITVQTTRSATRQWFIGQGPAAQYDPQTDLRISLGDWSDAHDEHVSWQRNVHVLKGQFQAQTMAGGRSTFENAPWWRVDDSIARRYHVQLQNRLMSFEPATGQSASGVPFHVKTFTHQALIIRYGSSASDLGGTVRLCFSDCEAIRNLRVQHLFPGGFTAFLSKMRGDSNG